MAEDTPLPPEETDPLLAALGGATGGPGAGDPNLDQASIDELLQQASFDDPSAIAGDVAPEAHASAPAATAVAPDTHAFNLPSLSQAVQDAQVGSIDLLRDVDLNVKIELGRARMLVEDVLKLGEGSVVELDKLAGDPVDVFVNDRLVARGEVLVLNDNFCVRINEIVAGVKEEGL
jgi:flagellar motor switch protein FliN/FliY